MKTAESEIMFNGLENYTTLDICHILEALSNHANSSFLNKIESFLTKNIDNVKPQWYLSILKSISEHTTVKDKFYGLLLKKILIHKSNINVEDLVEIVKIYSYVLRGDYSLLENLEEIFTENLSILDDSKKLDLLKTYLKVPKETNKKFIIISDIESFFSKGIPESFEDKVNLLDCLQSAKSNQKNVIDNLLQSILMQDVSSLNDIDSDSLFCLYSVLAYTVANDNDEGETSKLIVNFVPKYDILMIKNMAYLDNEQIDSLKHSLLILGYSEDSLIFKTLMNISEKIDNNSHNSKSELFSEKLKIVSSAINTISQMSKRYDH